MFSNSTQVNDTYTFNSFAHGVRIEVDLFFLELTEDGQGLAMRICMYVIYIYA